MQPAATAKREIVMLKKLLVRVSQVCALLIGALGLGVLWLHSSDLPRFEPPRTPLLRAPSTPEAIARGKKLASLLCNDCHQSDATHRLTGKHITDLPAVFGDIYSRNITQHPTRGIGRWSDGELVYFLRTGLRPDGEYVPPWMVKFPNVSDDDLLAIVAFLRSDDPLVAASGAQPPGVTKPSLLSKALARTTFGPLPYPAKKIEAPPASDRVATGRYLTFTYDCYACHSADFKSNDVLEPEKSAGYMGGGTLLVDGAGEPIFSANLTPDDDTGIGRWSERDFVRAVKTGQRPDGRVLHYPMLPRPALDDDELSAMYAYLRTIPKLHHDVKRPSAPALLVSAAPRNGEALFASYGCAACHGSSGVGPVGDLRTANEHYPSDEALRRWIDDAPNLKPGTRMPAWKGLIHEEDYGPLIEHVRALARPEAHAERVSNGPSSPRAE
jgi:mono/diheme cytochrome c family protein